MLVLTEQYPIALTAVTGGHWITTVLTSIRCDKDAAIGTLQLLVTTGVTYQLTMQLRGDDIGCPLHGRTLCQCGDSGMRDIRCIHQCSRSQRTTAATAVNHLDIRRNTVQPRNRTPHRTLLAGGGIVSQIVQAVLFTIGETFTGLPSH